MTNEQILTFDQLGLIVGQTVQIHPDPRDGSRRYDCSLVGCLPGESVILSALGNTGTFPTIEEGQEVVIRVVQANGVALFSSTVLFISDTPTFMVYLDLPAKVSFKLVRQSTRVGVSLPVLVSNLSNTAIRSVSGRMTDISLGGAKVEMSEDIGSTGDDIELKGKFKVGELQRVCRVNANICSRNVSGDGKYVFGLKMGDIEEDSMLVLLGYTYSVMVNGDEQGIY